MARSAPKGAKKNTPKKAARGRKGKATPVKRRQASTKKRDSPSPAPKKPAKKITAAQSRAADHMQRVIEQSVASGREPSDARNLESKEEADKRLAGPKFYTADQIQETKKWTVYERDGDKSPHLTVKSGSGWAWLPTQVKQKMRRSYYVAMCRCGQTEYLCDFRNDRSSAINKHNAVCPMKDVSTDVARSPSVGKVIDNLTVPQQEDLFAFCFTMSGGKANAVTPLSWYHDVVNVATMQPDQLKSWRKNRACAIMDMLRAKIAQHRFVALSLDGGMVASLGLHVLIAVIYVGRESYGLPPYFIPKGGTYTTSTLVEYMHAVLGPGRSKMFPGFDGLNCADKLSWFICDGASTNNCAAKVMDAVIESCDEIPTYQFIESNEWRSTLDTCLRQEDANLMAVRCAAHIDMLKIKKAQKASGFYFTRMKKFAKRFAQSFCGIGTRKHRFMDHRQQKQQAAAGSLKLLKNTYLIPALHVNGGAYGEMKANEEIWKESLTTEMLKEYGELTEGSVNHLRPLITLIDAELNSPHVGIATVNDTRYVSSTYQSFLFIHKNLDEIVDFIYNSPVASDKTGFAVKEMKKLLGGDSREHLESLRAELKEYVEVFAPVVECIREQCDVRRDVPTMHKAHATWQGVKSRLEVMHKDLTGMSYADWKKTTAGKSSKKPDKKRKRVSRKLNFDELGPEDIHSEGDEIEEDDETRNATEDDEKKWLNSESRPFNKVALVRCLLEEWLHDVALLWGDPTGLHHAAQYLDPKWVCQVADGQREREAFNDVMMKNVSKNLLVGNTAHIERSLKKYVAYVRQNRVEIMEKYCSSEDGIRNPQRFWEDVLKDEYWPDENMRHLAHLAIAVLWLPTSVTQCDSALSTIGAIFTPQMNQMNRDTASDFIVCLLNGDVEGRYFAHSPSERARAIAPKVPRFYGDNRRSRKTGAQM